LLPPSIHRLYISLKFVFVFSFPSAVGNVAEHFSSQFFILCLRGPLGSFRVFYLVFSSRFLSGARVLFSPPGSFSVPSQKKVCLVPLLVLPFFAGLLRGSTPPTPRPTANTLPRFSRPCQLFESDCANRIETPHFFLYWFSLFFQRHFLPLARTIPNLQPRETIDSGFSRCLGTFLFSYLLSSSVFLFFFFERFQPLLHAVPPCDRRVSVFFLRALSKNWSY